MNTSSKDCEIRYRKIVKEMKGNRQTYGHNRLKGKCSVVMKV